MKIEQTVIAAPPMPRSSHQYSTYFVVLLGIPFLLACLPFFLLRSEVFPRLSRTPIFQVTEFAFRAAGQNADVVIFGDSSASQDIDPSRMSAALGVKVLNLPSNLGELLVNDDLPLRRYIRADKPPALIVLYFTAWDFNYHEHAFDSSEKYDGAQTLVRHGEPSEIVAFAQKDPLFMAQFPLMFYRVNVHAFFQRSTDLREQARQLAASNGHSDALGEGHLESTCAIPAELIEKINFAWVGALSKKYSTPQTAVLAYAAPIPSCTNARTVVEHAAQVLPLTPPEVMPAELYIGDRYYAHLYPPAVPHATDSLISAARPVLAKQLEKRNEAR